MYFASEVYVFFRLKNYDLPFAIVSCKHHALGFYAHHLSPLKIQNEGASFANKLFRFVPLQESRNGLSLLSAKIHYHSDQVS